MGSYDEELTKVLIRKKNGKALGEDNINSELHKCASKEFHLKLLKCLNEVYAIGKSPDEWRNATVISFSKEETKKDSQKCRGISLLNTCCKTY